MPIKIKNKEVTIRTVGGHIYYGIVADVCEKFVQLTDVVMDRQGKRVGVSHLGLGEPAGCRDTFYLPAEQGKRGYKTVGSKYGKG